MTDRLNPEAFLAAKDAGREAFQANKDWHDITTAMLSAYDKSLALPAPRTITTVEELGALPTGSVIEKIDNDLCFPGDLPIVVKQSDGEWYGAWGWELDIDPTEIIPATVLYVPTHLDKQ